MRTTLLLSACLAFSTACLSTSPTDGTVDTGKSDGHNFCKSDAQLIEAARAALIEAEPDVYDADTWADAGRVEMLPDLDGDGLFDAMVFPGRQYASGNEEMVVMHADPDTDCIDPTVLGHFSGIAVETPEHEEGSTQLDLRIISNETCETVFTWYTFDGSQYIELASDSTSSCDS